MKKLLSLSYLVLAAVAAGQVAGDYRVDERRADGKWDSRVITPAASSILAWDGSKVPVPILTSSLATSSALTAGLAGKQPLATVLTNTTAAFTTAQETKLSGIASGATADSADAVLLARANHTGTQSYTTISGLGVFATGTDAANLTGTLAAARIAAGSLSISQVASLQTTLDGKAASVHTHSIADVTDLALTLADKASLSDGADFTGDVSLNSGVNYNAGFTPTYHVAAKAAHLNALGLDTTLAAVTPGAGVATALGNATNASGGLVTFGGSAGALSVSSVTSSTTMDVNAVSGLNLQYNGVMRIRLRSATTEVTQNTASTTTSNGALTVVGGVGIGGSVNIGGNLVASGNLITATQTPASASAAGTAGTITWDANYIYICTATNTWKRVAISTW